MNPRETIVTELTPSGRGAIAVVLVEGPQAIDFVEHKFQPRNGKPLNTQPINRIVLGRWGGLDGEELIVCRTGADRVEVHPHGGRAAVRNVIESLAQLSATEIDWRDWTRRTVACPLQTEAQIALADAPTIRTADILLDQFDGALTRAIKCVVEACQAGDAAHAIACLDEMLQYANVGLHLIKPWRVVLTGAPNVGKSSLINVLVGFDRAIVYDQPGTTRDVVTQRTAIDGWPVELADTAGLRAGADDLEQAGIDEAQRLITRADLLLVVLDASLDTSLQQQQAELMFENSVQRLTVVNKTDIATDQAAIAIGESQKAIATSAITSEGVRELLAAVGTALVPNPPPAGAAMPFTHAHARTLQNARIACTQGNLQNAISELEAI